MVTKLTEKQKATFGLQRNNRSIWLAGKTSRLPFEIGQPTTTNMDPWTAVVGALAYQFSANILHILEYLIVLLIPRIRPYKISRNIGEECSTNPLYTVLMKSLSNGRYLGVRNGEPYGLVVGKWYLAYVGEDIAIYCSPKQHQKMVGTHNNGRVMIRTVPSVGNGPSWSEIGYKETVPTKAQTATLNYIIANMAYINVFWIYGPPGTGKTTIALQLAMKLGYQLVFGMNPFRHVFCYGENVVHVYDEADGMIRIAINPKESKDKQTEEKDPKNIWNTKLDSFKMQSSSIFIMTSNIHPREIEGCTEAYWRPGRMAIIGLTKPIKNAKELLKPVKF